MADTERENAIGFVDKRRLQSDSASGLSNVANYGSVSALRTRLTAINAGYYTAARLNQMTKNDMVYAVRVNDDLAGIK
jgi:hypothetical protein